MMFLTMFWCLSYPKTETLMELHESEVSKSISENCSEGGTYLPDTKFPLETDILTHFFTAALLGIVTDGRRLAFICASANGHKSAGQRS